MTAAPMATSICRIKESVTSKSTVETISLQSIVDLTTLAMFVTRTQTVAAVPLNTVWYREVRVEEEKGSAPIWIVTLTALNAQPNTHVPIAARPACRALKL